MDLYEHQRHENIGDALWNMLTRIYLIPESGFTQNSKKIVNIVQGNEFLAAVAIYMGIEPHPDKFDGKDVYGDNSHYAYADEMEVRIYHEFLEGGFEQANDFFVNNVLPHCRSVEQAQSFIRNKQVPKFEGRGSRAIKRLNNSVEKKESTYELQLVDCNCNDCKFMVRDLNRLPKKYTPVPINYGKCSKFDKEVSFIPGTCQLDTQQCFVHRKD